jgi:hypothetical protein
VRSPTNQFRRSSRILYEQLLGRATRLIQRLSAGGTGTAQNGHPDDERSSGSIPDTPRDNSRNSGFSSRTCAYLIGIGARATNAATTPAFPDSVGPACALRSESHAVGRSQIVSVMSIEDNARRVLLALASFGQRPDDRRVLPARR